MCSFNIAPVDYKGDFEFDEGGSTYKDEAGMLVALGVLMFLIMCAQCTCCNYCLFSTPVGKKKDKKKDKEG